MSQTDFESLRFLAKKLRCLGHFLETQDPNHVCPADFDEVQYGLSMLINEITVEMLEIAQGVKKKSRGVEQVTAVMAEKIHLRKLLSQPTKQKINSKRKPIHFSFLNSSTVLLPKSPMRVTFLRQHKTTVPDKKVQFPI